MTWNLRTDEVSYSGAGGHEGPPGRPARSRDGIERKAAALQGRDAIERKVAALQGPHVSAAPHAGLAMRDLDPGSAVETVTPPREAILLADRAEGWPGTGYPSLTPILGRSPLQRHAAHLARLGIERCGVLFAPGPHREAAWRECAGQLAALGLEGVRFHSGRSAGTGLDAGNETGGGEGPDGDVLLLRAEGVYDPRLYRLLLASAVPTAVVDHIVRDDGRERCAEDGHRPQPIGLARVPGGWLPPEVGNDALRWDRILSRDRGAAARTVAVDELPTYLPDLRRHLRPYWCVIRTPRDARRAEGMILDSAQKGVLDFPARFLHPLPENLLTRWLARTRVTPNQLTVATAAVGFAAAFLFATQHFGLALLLAFATNVLDGVDGKLARVTLRTSRFGDRLDHVLDVLFEFSWYVGLGWGLWKATDAPFPLQAAAALVVVMIACRAVSGLYRKLSGRQIHDHRRFDRGFRLVAGRRNVYTVVLLAGFLVGRLEESFYVCLTWGVLTLLTYSVRTLIALAPRLSAKHPWP